MFILRYRAPERYGRWRDATQAHRPHPDGAAIVLGHALGRLADDNLADAAGRPRTERPPLKSMRLMDDPAEQAEMDEAEEVRQRLDAVRREQEFVETLERLHGPTPVGPAFRGDVARSF